MPRKEPDRLFIEKKDRGLYEKLKSSTIFKDKENKDLFLMAMAYGFKNNAKRKIEDRDGFVRAEYLKPRDLAMINAIALSEGSIELLDQPSEVFRFAEEYASAGVKLIVGNLESTSIESFEKKIEKDLTKLFLEIEKEKK